MSDDVETPTTPVPPVPPVAPGPPPSPVIVERKRPNKVFQAAAWVGIAAGVTFIVAVVFFSGFYLGKSSDGGHHGGPHREAGMFHREGPPPMGPPHIFFGPAGPGGLPGGPGEGGPGGQQGPAGPGNPGGPTFVPRP
ncbi:hypothetical protein SBI67_04310 [Mycolicibacterium sp. 120266]|uniref:hypothetical protein n=1 Tax=Mycolicibacterium sp. 120266 TaxID=3090601 RepID=UPI00299F163E|nr:hypothetical protein [Mycolicibacterium sp. 120266]MDX1871334.1 hypothetical protein [Mycolicibacterium sp. 120266]